MKIKFFVDKVKAREDSYADFSYPDGYRPREPFVKNDTDAGIDLFSPASFQLSPGEMKVVDTFVAFEMPPASVGLIWPRGGDVHLVGSGVIDEGYRGTIKVRVFNPTNETMLFDAGSSLGQMVLLCRLSPEPIKLEETKTPPSLETTRGGDGRINE